MMRTNGRKRCRLIAAAVVVAAGFLIGCPDGSLLGLVGESGESDTNANLSALTVSQGELYPPFNPATTEYEVSLDSGISSIVITGTAATAGASVSDNSGTSQSLESRANPITITVTAGDGTTTKAYVVTVNRGAVGVLDSTFDAGNELDFVASLALQTGGRVIACGTAGPVWILGSDGGLESNFNPLTYSHAGNWTSALVAQPDGKMVMGGWFTEINDVARGSIARLHANGTLDEAFHPNANDAVYSIVVDSDGSMVIGGDFTAVWSETHSRVVRVYGSTGQPMVAGWFSDGTNGVVRRLALDDSGRIVLAGGFTVAGGQERNGIARLHPSGGLDTGFDPGDGPSDGIMAIAMQSDGKIVIGGWFTSVDGTARNQIARLNADGSLDMSFNPNANGTVQALAVQSDGKIVVGGDFTSVGGAARNRIARLNADGSADMSFNPNANGTVQALAVQSDGRIVIGGGFSFVGGVTRNRIARLK